MRRLAALIAVVALFSACGHGKARASVPKSKSPNVNVPGSELEGVASYYAEPYNGRRTASGEIFDTYNGMTAAHKTLPFNTVVRVKNLKNGEEVDVRINDRGPFVNGRVIDLSLAAAKEIDLVRAGIAPVKLKVLKDGSPTSKPSSPAAAPIVATAPLPLPPAKPGPASTTPIVPAPAEPAAAPVQTVLTQEARSAVIDPASLPAYGVQVGAFQSETAAIRLRDDLAMRYMNVSILTIVTDQALYRVRVGSDGLASPNSLPQLATNTSIRLSCG